MLTSRGTIMAEHTVTCMEPDRYWCITGGGSELHDLRSVSLNILHINLSFYIIFIFYIYNSINIIVTIL